MLIRILLLVILTIIIQQIQEEPILAGATTVAHVHGDSPPLAKTLHLLTLHHQEAVAQALEVVTAVGPGVQDQVAEAQDHDHHVAEETK